ncbi:hypothetical protein EJ110_NYTH52327 [Nymphaea thermarum]|nr:hypothetical protein EJ110_NYTH52327 [Nymphaea thermarum]
MGSIQPDIILRSSSACLHIPSSVARVAAMSFDTSLVKKGEIQRKKDNIELRRDECLDEGIISDGLTSPNVRKCGIPRGPMDQFITSDMQQPTINNAFKKEERKQVYSAIGKTIIEDLEHESFDDEATEEEDELIQYMDDSNDDELASIKEDDNDEDTIDQFI